MLNRFLTRAFISIACTSLLAVAGCGVSSGTDPASSGGGSSSGGATINRVPVISGAPTTDVRATQAYQFTPSASDPDGDRLTFSATNVPRWASFDTATGKLAGTPAVSDVGTFSNIVISVSDGTANASLGGFAINVTDLGAVTVTWAAPTQNTDGSSLADLAGFKVYYGTSSRNYGNVVTLNNPAQRSFSVSNLVAGTYYFAVSAMSTSGIESDYSGEVSRTIR